MDQLLADWFCIKIADIAVCDYGKSFNLANQSLFQILNKLVGKFIADFNFITVIYDFF